MAEYTELIIGLALPVILLVGWMILLSAIRLWTMPGKSKLVGCNYIIFEAEPENLSRMQADLADNGWKLKDMQKTQSNAMRYRFEKGGAGARCLSEIYNFNKSMPRTANRKTGNDSLIKIVDIGSIGSTADR